MKTIRYIAAWLLILTGVLHTLPFFKAVHDPNAVPMLIFGIIYFSIGILLILDLKIATLFGIIFPLIGILSGFFVIGTENWNFMLTILIAIDFVIILCCLALFLKRERQFV